MCYCMKVSKNSYYNWLKKKGMPIKETIKAFLKVRILELFNQSREIYGSYRIQKMLERENLFYSRSYVAVIMKELGLKSVLRKKFVVTTDSNHTYPIAKNILARNFQCSSYR